MNYFDCIKLLTSTSKFQIKLGLYRINKLLNLIDNPQNKIKIIHVAGTNGKGSVCACIANILIHSGYKTGLYTSPHLIDYTERITINNIQITQNEFAFIIEEICNIANKNNIDLTEFEILTAAAFKYFYDNKVDFAIIETGLGGNFDATNVCENPLCSVITSISLDHTDRLGNTIEQIAYEKAGIIKHNSCIITSKSNLGYSVIQQQAKEKNSKLITVKKDIDIIYENGINYAVINNQKFEFALLGLYQKQNLALVAAIVDFLKKQGFNIKIKEGLKTVKWRARLEYLKEDNILIDGAHNPDAAYELKKSLNYYFPNKKRIFIYGTINTKDYLNIAKNLFDKNDEIYYYEFHHKNAVSFDEYTKNVKFIQNIKKYSKEILKNKELKILTGSFYMIGEFLQKDLKSI